MFFLVFLSVSFNYEARFNPLENVNIYLNDVKGHSKLQSGFFLLFCGSRFMNQTVEVQCCEDRFMN